MQLISYISASLGLIITIGAFVMVMEKGTENMPVKEIYIGFGIGIILLIISYLISGPEFIF